MKIFGNAHKSSAGAGRSQPVAILARPVRFVLRGDSRRAILSRRGTGFTLVEAVIAMAILGLALFSSFALLVHSYAIMRRTNETLYVNRLMESAIEMTRNLAYDELTGQAWSVSFATDYPVFELYGKAVNSAATDDAEYGLELKDGQGTIDTETISADLTKVIVKVTWEPFRLRPSTKTVVTYISRNGINKR